MSTRAVTQMSRSFGCSRARWSFRLGSEQRVCGPGDIIVIPGGTEHEAWIHEDTEVIDFFAPPRDDFLRGGKPAYERRLNGSLRLLTDGAHVQFAPRGSAAMRARVMPARPISN